MLPTPEHETEKVLYATDELTGLIALTLRAMQESAATA